MSGSINRVVLVGRLTSDVEIRKTTSGTSVAQFTVACDRRFQSKGQDGMANNNQQTADFISCVAWRLKADFLANYATKGTLIGVEGSIQTRSYEDQTGRKVYVTEILADSVEILESRKSSSRSSGSMGNASVYTKDIASSPVMDEGFNTGDTNAVDPDELPF